MNNNYEEANKTLDWYLNTFGPERFYLEVQPEDQADQITLNKKLYELSAQRDVRLVATVDCHYVAAQDREAHEIMLAIQTHDKLSNPNRYTFGDCRVYMRTSQEMLDKFKEHESAVWNTGVIADQCNFDFETGKLFFPKFEIPQEHTQDTYFKALCQKGLDTLLSKIVFQKISSKNTKNDLNLEADLIINMGFVGYFLVVSDFISMVAAQWHPCWTWSWICGWIISCLGIRNYQHRSNSL